MSAYSFKNYLPKVLTLVAFSHFCLVATPLDSIKHNTKSSIHSYLDTTLIDSKNSLDSIPQNPASQNPNLANSQNNASQDFASQDSTTQEFLTIDSLPTDSASTDSASTDLTDSKNLADSPPLSRVQSSQDLQALQSPQSPIIAQILNRTHLYGHIGTFGKSSFGRHRDSYLTLHFAANISYDFYAKNDHLLNATIGIWGATSLLGGALRHNAHEYLGNHIGDEVGNDWNNNNAFFRYSYRGFSVQAGRFDALVDWVGEHMQGAHIAYDFKYAEIYGAWVNEYAHSSREETSNFVEFKELYYGGNEFVLGAKLGRGEYRLGDIYAYYLTDFFYMIGTKISQDIALGSSPFTLNILAHGNYLSSQRKGWAIGSVNESRKLGDTYLITLQPSISYERAKVAYKLGVGYARTGANDFLQAHMGGNLYIFEAEDETPFMYNVIAPGGYHNGSQQTNMFQGNTDSWWGFGALKINPVVLSLTARHSKGTENRSLGGEQLQIALGFGWNIYKGLHLGLVGVYMEQKMRDDANAPTNTSYGKAFLEYRFFTP